MSDVPNRRISLSRCNIGVVHGFSAAKVNPYVQLSGALSHRFEHFSPV